jgi:hypothetical protein
MFLISALDGVAGHLYPEGRVLTFLLALIHYKAVDEMKI